MHIVLNVGGSKYATSVSTLQNHKNTFFGGLIFSLDQTSNTEKEIFIDRDGTHFKYILNWLRGSKVLPHDKLVIEELIVETDFYCLTDMKTDLTQRLKHYRYDSVESTLYNILQKMG